ncbi:hypothetical protein FRC01_000551 [Tulasnella sp. 417]|nr:hypothetical protein FRC01_000551 [Tulasnella sp. 417]
MSSEPLYRYITGQELAELIKSGKEPLKDYAVVDVRGQDFSGGNIVSCLQSPSEKFEEDVDELIEKTKDVPRVIFHCHMSQQRGPKAALAYAKRRQVEKDATADVNTAQPEQSQAKQEILVLRGGFAEFQSAFKDDPELVEKWQKEELAELIKSGKEPLKDYVVVDVRDHDFLGGNIVNCLRSPSETFAEDLDGLVAKTKDVPKVIFHCALSQQRGPKAALTYAKRRRAEKEANADPDAARLEQAEDEQDILVLRGGFTEFQSAFKPEKELAELIKSGKEPHKDYVVIDVRDDDFAGGNIVNCFPSPSQTFEDGLDSLLEDTKDVPKIIFHCALSQQRGPWAALRYARRRKAEAEAMAGTDAGKESQEGKQEIFVLEGGFTKFQQDFKDDPQLVEKWDEKIWEEQTWEEEQDRDEEVWALDD